MSSHTDAGSTEGCLLNSVAVVTGGGTGIGRSIARILAKAGASIVITGRRQEPLATVVGEIHQSGGRAHAVVGDVSKPEDCQRIIMETLVHFNHLNILINNAGIAHFGTLDQLSDDQISAMLNVDLLGPILMTKYATPELTKFKTHGTAAIVNIASSVADRPVKNFSVYSAAKAGLAHFSRCSALDLADERVRVNCIQPGVVDTPIFETMMPASHVKDALEGFAKQTPLGRIGLPKDIAEAVLFLCSPKAAWITGSVLTVDGGINLA